MKRGGTVQDQLETHTIEITIDLIGSERRRLRLICGKHSSLNKVATEPKLPRNKFIYTKFKAEIEGREEGWASPGRVSGKVIRLLRPGDDYWLISIH